MSGDKKIVKEIVDLMPGVEDNYFDVKYTEKNMNFTEFGRAAYDHGTNNVQQMPYFYSGYQIYEADYQSKQYKFYNFVNMTN